MGTLKKTLSLIMCMVLLMSFCCIGNFVYAEETRNGVVVVSSGSLNVRSSASTSASKLGTLSSGDKVEIYGDDISDSSGTVWYKIKYSSGFGYVSAEYVQIIYEYVPDADFEQNLTNQKFPESYKELLRQLHAAHPEWIFLADHLSMTFEEALTQESKVGKTLVAGTAVDSQKSMEFGAYDWAKKTYAVYDSGGWVTAHKDTVAYYMEPRNFLNESSIFLFLDQSYNSEYQKKEGLNKMLEGTFMDSDKGFPEKGYATYADLLLEAAKQSKVNPFVLAAMILVEQGTNGTGGCISGTVSGYQGYYNYFNIGAYAEGSYSAVQRGLRYAKGLIGGNGKTYDRPWNTRAKSIIGGAKFYGNNYVARGQDTLYYKKYNVIVPDYYINQYMTNVAGAVQEASKIKNAYSGVGVDTMPLVFSIPVYKNMPDKNTTSLSTAKGANNYYLESLSIKGFTFSPTFDRYTNDYTLAVSENTSQIEISATVPSGAKVSGTGKISLKNGENKITLAVTAASGKVANYTISVFKEGEGAEQAPSTPEIKGEYNNGTNITGVAVGTDVQTFIKKLKVENGTVEILTASGKAKTTGTMATGDKIQVKDSSQKVTIAKNVVIYGDVNGDGKISIVDLAAVQKHLLEVSVLKGANLAAADVNKDSKTTIIDLAGVQKHLLEIKLITQ